MNKFFKITNWIIGVISVALGLLNILITYIIVYCIQQITGRLPTINRPFCMEILNTCTVLETFSKPSGLFLGLIGIFQKNKTRLVFMGGLILNVIAIIWTVMLLLNIY